MPPLIYINLMLDNSAAGFHYVTLRFTLTPCRAYLLANSRSISGNPKINRQKAAWYQCRSKHDIIDVLMLLPTPMRMLGLRQPEIQDLVTNPFIL